MKKQRNRIKHLSKESKRILSTSRERKNRQLSRTDYLHKSLRGSSRDMSDESVYERLYSGKSSSRNLTIKDTKISGLSNLITSWSKTSKRSKGKFHSKIKAYKSFQELPLVGRNTKLLKEYSGNPKFSKEKRKSSKSKESSLAVSISNKLYSDAIQRKKVKGKKPKITAPRERVSTKSNKLLFQRFMEDFELVSRVRKIRKSNVSILNKKSKINTKTDKILGYQEVEMF